MGRYSGWLVTEIERRTMGRLSDTDRMGLVDEVESHLDEAIRARLELGLDPLQAEREAVAAFGEPGAYVNDLMAIHRQSSDLKTAFRSWLWGDQKTMLTLWLGSIYPALWLVFDPFDMHSPLLGFGVTVFAIGLAWNSYRARRVDAIPVTISSVGIYLTWCLIGLLSHYPTLTSTQFAFQYDPGRSIVNPSYVLLAASINLVFGGWGWSRCQPKRKWRGSQA